MIDIILMLVFLSFVVAGLSSAWMYSSLFCELNNWWKTYFLELSKRFELKYKHNGRKKIDNVISIIFFKLSKLSTCGLCNSFWIAFVIQWWFFVNLSFVTYFLSSVAIAFTSWVLVNFAVCISGDRL